MQSRNLYAIDGQVSPAVAYFNPSNLQDQSQHPPYFMWWGLLRVQSLVLGMMAVMGDLNCNGIRGWNPRERE
uniref:Uncharacterized protein n=1 Tax=Salix viminalis TaxID=40686 RepID=A0A6N2MML8_SALVM